MEFRCPRCHSPIALADDTPLSDVTCPSCGSDCELLVDETQTFHAAAKPIGRFEQMEEAHRVISHYRVNEKVGAGGMGEVYLAEQQEPLRRKVALKIIKLGMDTKQVIARFDSERQALAMMNHPNIARVFDAGMTEPGRPFFVMEYARPAEMSGTGTPWFMALTSSVSMKTVQRQPRS